MNCASGSQAAWRAERKDNKIRDLTKHLGCNVFVHISRTSLWHSSDWPCIWLQSWSGITSKSGVQQGEDMSLWAGHTKSIKPAWWESIAIKSHGKEKAEDGGQGLSPGPIVFLHGCSCGVKIRLVFASKIWLTLNQGSKVRRHTVSLMLRKSNSHIRVFFVGRRTPHNRNFLVWKFTMDALFTYHARYTNSEEAKTLIVICKVFARLVTGIVFSTLICFSQFKRGQL